MANFWEGLLGGGVGLGGFYKLYEDMDKAKGGVGNFFDEMRQGIDDRTQFTPWTMRGGVGQAAGGPDGMKFGLNDQMKGISNNMFGRGGNMLNRAMQDIAPRQQEIYEAMRATQMPGERRAQQAMDQQMFSRGRTGMGSQEYGASPEQFALAKARAEADNSAFFGARDAAMGEQMQQYNMGLGMNQAGYMPYDYLYKQAGLGLQNQNMAQNMQMNNANMWSQLGLGEQTARQNYQNLQNQMFIEMMKAGSGMASGIGGAVDQGGGLWDTLKSIGGGAKDIYDSIFG